MKLNIEEVREKLENETIADTCAFYGIRSKTLFTMFNGSELDELKKRHETETRDVYKHYNDCGLKDAIIRKENSLADHWLKKIKPFDLEPGDRITAYDPIFEEIENMTVTEIHKNTFSAKIEGLDLFRGFQKTDYCIGKIRKREEK